MPDAYKAGLSDDGKFVVLSDGRFVVCERPKCRSRARGHGGEGLNADFSVWFLYLSGGPKVQKSDGQRIGQPSQQTTIMQNSK